jgi:hypothetical protein
MDPYMAGRPVDIEILITDRHKTHVEVRRTN